MSELQFKNSEHKERRMLTLLLFFTFMVFYTPFAISLRINEINSNPLNQTYADEYVEIYGFKGFNLTNFTICDNKSCDNLTLYKWLNSNYALITTNQSNYKDVNATVYVVDDSRIGNGLNNIEDCIYLRYRGILIDYICYNISVEKGNSLQFINGTWIECSITPGEENKCENIEEFKIIYPEIVLNKGKEFSVLINALNLSKLYDVKIDVKDINGTRLSEIYDENLNKWKSSYYYINSVNLSNKTFLIKINGNYVGESLMEVKIRDIKTYEIPIKIVNYYVKGQQENSTNESNESVVEKSYVEIKEYPEEAKEGEIIKVKIGVYRGNTRKYAVYAYIYDKENNKKVSEETVFYATNKYINYTLTIPIKIKSIGKDKKYEIILEGLDKKDQKIIYLRKEEKSNETKKTSEEKTSIKEYENKSYDSFHYKYDDFEIYFNVQKNIQKDYFIDIMIKNGDKWKKFYIWSYLYSGTTCYSCEKSREENLKVLELEPNKSKSVRLKDQIIKEIEGIQKVKVKLLEEGKKTPKEFSFDVFVNSPYKDKVNKIIYESKKNKRWITIFSYLILLFAFILIVIIFKKEL